MAYVRPAGREPCRCGTPYNTILERLDALASDIASAADMARDAYDVANAQAGNAAQYASDARDAADDALIHAQAAQQSADDALAEATAAAGSASDAADSAADAAQALSDINDTIATVLASDLGAKVDKLTTAGFYLYSHNGSTQGEVQPVVAPTAATIPIRDSDGRMQAADPASGATDKTLVTANWVSQTGDSAPNNLMHRTGNETITGVKTIETLFSSYLTVNENHFTDGADPTTYRQVFKYNMTGGAQYHHVFLNITQRRYAISTGIAKITINRNSSASIVWLCGNSIDTTKFVITKEADNIFTLWYKSGSSGADGIECDVLFETGGNGPNLRTQLPTDDNWYAITASGYTDSESNVHTFLDYQESIIGSMV